MLGRGSLGVILGRPGEGKTALLALAVELARQRGLRALPACGTRLEAGVAFGVVRQMLGPPARALTPAQRSELFTGAVTAAARVVGVVDGREPLDPSAAQQGLYWLLGDLAAQEPALLVVDDAHWADEPSLGWLAALPRRIEELPVLVLIASRPAAYDGRGGPLAALVSDAAAHHLAVGPLAPASVAELARRELGRAPDMRFVASCHIVTGGNPLAVIEVLRDLRREGLAPVAVPPTELVDRAPEAIALHVRSRLESLGPEAIAVARALAILGDRAEMRDVARVAQIGYETAARLLEALRLAGIVADDDVLRFDHPLVHAAVRGSIFHPERELLHRRAAAVLAAAGADSEVVAAHVLLAPRAGEADNVVRLRGAAEAALRRGSPRSAARYLERAVAEPPAPSERGRVLAELGRAAWLAADWSATDHLEAARELTRDPRERARLDLMLAEICLYAGRRRRLSEVIARGERDLAGQDAGLALALNVMRASSLVSLDSGWSSDRDPEFEALARAVGSDTRLARQLQLSLALVESWRGRHSAADIVRRAARALDETMLQRADPGPLTGAGHGLIGLIFADELDQAIEMAGVMLTHGRINGSPLMLGLANNILEIAHVQRGALADAVACGEVAVELATATNSRFAEAVTRGPLASALIEQNRLDDAESVLLAAPTGLDALTGEYFMRAATARLHLARGARAAAIAELEAIGRLATERHVANPAFAPWRSSLALLLSREDRARARDLAESELADGRRIMLPRPVGVALRALAATQEPEARERTLREAIAALEQSPAQLELARAEIDLGRHLRQHGRRSAAREPLRRALERAHRCGAEQLIALAGDELRAAGGRPRRPWLSGPAALTPSELRVARLAAGGLSNREIAESLFVTLKTVEMHLTNGYRKLGAGSRRELVRRLDA